MSARVSPTPDTSTCDIIKEIRHRRILNDLTQKDLEAKVGVCKNYIQRIERGRINPGLYNIIAIVGALGGRLKIEWNT